MDAPMNGQRLQDRKAQKVEHSGQLLTPSPTPSPIPESPIYEKPDHTGDETSPANKFNGHRPQLNRDASSTNGTGLSISIVNETPVSKDDKKQRSVEQVTSPPSTSLERDKVLKLSPARIQELTSSPTSLPVRTASPSPAEVAVELSPIVETSESQFLDHGQNGRDRESMTAARDRSLVNGALEQRGGVARTANEVRDVQQAPIAGEIISSSSSKVRRPELQNRAASTPVMRRKQSSTGRSRAPLQELNDKNSKHVPQPLNTKDGRRGEGISSALKPSPIPESLSSPVSSLPLPPLSLPTYLQLELSTERPSPLYIQWSNAESVYESSKIKLERLRDFLSLCVHFEPFVGFGFFVCLDAWLYLFTILPLRFLNAVWILLNWWAYRLSKEVKDIATYIYSGIGRVWRRRHPHAKATISGSSTPSRKPSQTRRRSTSLNSTAMPRDNAVNQTLLDEQTRKYRSRVFRHRRSKSTPSALKPSHKADLLKGLLMIASCSVLMRYDASRMYHSIRGQAAIKLYVIYNALEVGDRLLSALGQDVLECLFSDENLERDTDGRSKIIRPFWMFMLALFYTTLHATALFYQIITLNVAVNSYSNALLTLLMSNQFVEIKSTVFKKIEKENLFQLACADIVERFQLWLMLLIIAMRNIVEVGGLSISLSSAMSPIATSAPTTNNSSSFLSGIVPSTVLTIPDWVGQVVTPFLIVLGSEMVVDWIKHAYTCKFNLVKSNIYGRFLDVIAKDYYTHAFAEQNLTKRFGLPVIPLACLFIRSLVQAYHMFLATNMPMPLASSATSLSLDNEPTASTPAATAAIAHIDQIFRRALGRSSFGGGSDSAEASNFSWWNVDDLIAIATMAVVFLIFYLLVLAFKLLLGMCLLGYSRRRYKGMRDRERQQVDTDGRRIGLWGMTELGDDRRKWIYADDPDGLQAMKDRERKGREKAKKGEVDLDPVERYSMVGKRIW